MALVANRRSVMTLYSDPVDPFSHRVRLVLAEKGVTVEIVDLDPEKKPEELLDLNPYNTVPVLVDRDLVLYQSRIIMEYLDERFPHPPLMPVYPVARANARLMIYRIDRDWYALLSRIERGTPSEAQQARKELRDSLTAAAPVFEETRYFLSDDYSLLDCAVLPVLWRLPHAGVTLPPQARGLESYAERMFARDSFRASLSHGEREMREGYRPAARR